MVLGDKAYSWATKKEMPEPGKAILLFEQPIHDRHYALSEKVIIPKGEYGGGVTYLDWVRKAKVEGDVLDPDKLVIHAKDGTKLLLKKLDPVKYGEKAWLFKNLSAPYEEGPDSTFTHKGKDYSVDQVLKVAAGSPVEDVPVRELDWILQHGRPDPKRIAVANLDHPVVTTMWEGKRVVVDGFHRLTKAKLRGLETIKARHVDLDGVEPIPMNKQSNEIASKFTPDLTPAQMEILGVLRHKGSQYGEGTDKDNYFGVRASLDAWPEKWHNEQHPQGWFQWYKGYSEGKRTDDDERQMKRWISFKARHLAQLQKADPTLADLSVQPKRRQALLNWGIAPGVNVEEEVSKKMDNGVQLNKYLTKIAKTESAKWKGKEKK